MDNGELIRCLQYLEEKYPQHPLLPQDVQRKAVNHQVIRIASFYHLWLVNCAYFSFQFTFKENQECGVRVLTIFIFTYPDEPKICFAIKAIKWWYL